MRQCLHRVHRFAEVSYPKHMNEPTTNNVSRSEMGKGYREAGCKSYPTTGYLEADQSFVTNDAAVTAKVLAVVHDMSRLVRSKPGQETCFLNLLCTLSPCLPTFFTFSLSSQQSLQIHQQRSSHRVIKGICVCVICLTHTHPSLHPMDSHGNKRAEGLVLW